MEQQQAIEADLREAMNENDQLIRSLGQEKHGLELQLSTGTNMVKMSLT